MNKKVKKIVEWALSGVLILILLSSGILKLSGLPQAEEMAASVGGTKNLLFLGVLEIIIVLLFVIPRTKVVGLFLMIAYFGGAMATHLITGEPILIPTLIQTLVWLTAFFAIPELNDRLVKKNIATTKP